MSTRPVRRSIIFHLHPRFKFYVGEICFPLAALFPGFSALLDTLRQTDAWIRSAFKYLAEGKTDFSVSRALVFLLSTFSSIYLSYSVVCHSPFFFRYLTNLTFRSFRPTVRIPYR